MPITINNKTTQLYPLGSESLKHGQIYEGSDKLLYVGVEVADSGIIGVGINHDYYITTFENDDEEITFRTINVELNYQ